MRRGPCPFPPGKLRRAGIIAAAVAVAIAVTGIVIREIKAHEVASWTYAQATPTVAVVLPQREVHASQLVLPGNIEAWYAAPIYARVSGYVKRWYFDYGAHVKKGQVLAVIDTPDLDAQFAAAKATLNAARARVNVFKANMQFAQTTYARWRDSPQGVVSEQERESKKAGYESAVAQYDAAIANVKSDEGAVDRLQALEGFRDIVAPFDGVVTARNTDIGNLITAGSGGGGGSAPQLFRVADVHRMRVFVQVPQAMSGSITGRHDRGAGSAAVPGPEVRGSRCDHRRGDRSGRAHPARRAARDEPRWAATAWHVCGGALQSAPATRTCSRFRRPRSSFASRTCRWPWSGPTDGSISSRSPSGEISATTSGFSAGSPLRIGWSTIRRTRSSTVRA